MKNSISRARWRAGAVLVVTATVAIASYLPSVSPASAAATVDESTVAGWVNDFRALDGLPPLSLHTGMSDDARAWSGEMANAGQSSHDPNFSDSCVRFPNFIECAENIGSGTSIGNVQGNFQRSLGHADIQRCDCTHMGIGIVFRNGKYWVTQRFVHSGATTTTGPTSTTQPTTTTTQPTTTTTTTPPGPTLTRTQKFVTAAYTDFLGRQPSINELAHWSARVTESNVGSRQTFLKNLAYSDEWIGRVVDDYYRVSLGRPGDTTGRNYWIGVIRNEVATPETVAASFYASEEYFIRRGRSLDAWVSDLYTELLHRAPEATGKNYWIGVARERGRLAVTTSFYRSPETLNVRVNNLYQQLLGRNADNGGRAYWAGVIADSGNDVDLALFLASSSEYFTRSQRRF